MKIYLITTATEDYEVVRAIKNKSAAEEIVKTSHENLENYAIVANEYRQLPEVKEYFLKLSSGDKSAESPKFTKQWFSERGFDEYPSKYYLVEIELEE